jgi:hypothetical protein
MAAVVSLDVGQSYDVAIWKGLRRIFARRQNLEMSRPSRSIRFLKASRSAAARRLFPMSLWAFEWHLVSP